TLEALKGKLVLLEFWGLWCSPCLKKIPELVRLHKKYARDGLIIIAIHDSSLDRASLIKQGQKAVNLSDVRFRVAIDSPASGPSGTQARGAGKGKTIEAYGVNRVPTFVLVASDGKVYSFGGGDLESNINLLLYGHTKNLNRKLSSQQELLFLARKEFLLAGISIAGLLVVIIYCAVRSRSVKQAKQV
ncbi:MAG: TlpA disulfide reductase family protein, partial [Sedimentisphaerales bacterium]